MKWSSSTTGVIEDESTSIEVDMEDVMRDRGAFIDISASGSHPLRWGEETLFVNAAVMNVSYFPRNAPWVIDLELPKA